MTEKNIRVPIWSKRPTAYSVIFAAAFLCLVVGSASAQLKKVRLSITSPALTDLQFKIAQIKGFYREEGLEVETILIRGAVGLQALLGGSVDYSSAAGSVIAAGVGGVPVKIVLIVNAKPQFDLVAHPQIKSIPQLKGKLIGISSRGGAVDLLTQLMLSQSGLTPNKDATLLVIGAPAELVLAFANRAHCRNLAHVAASAHSCPRGIQSIGVFGGLFAQLSFGRNRGNGRENQVESSGSAGLRAR